MKYHITFEYFPEISKASLPDIRENVRQLSKYFPLACEAYSLAGFPSSQRARVIVALLRLGNPKIVQVCGIERFTPHITVGYARIGRVRVPSTKFQNKFSLTRPGLFLSDKGVYTEIGEKSNISEIP